jgi:hypothetical protein
MREVLKVAKSRQEVSKKTAGFSSMGKMPTINVSHCCMLAKRVQKIDGAKVFE